MSCRFEIEIAPGQSLADRLRNSQRGLLVTDMFGFTASMMVYEHPPSALPIFDLHTHSSSQTLPQCRQNVINEIVNTTRPLNETKLISPSIKFRATNEDLSTDPVVRKRAHPIRQAGAKCSHTQTR